MKEINDCDFYKVSKCLEQLPFGVVHNIRRIRILPSPNYRAGYASTVEHNVIATDVLANGVGNVLSYLNIQYFAAQYIPDDLFRNCK